MSAACMQPRRWLRAAFALLLAMVAGPMAWGQNAAPLAIGLTAEFGIPNGHAAQAIEKGIQLALREINDQGGVLGRMLVLKKRDDRGLPARATDNFRALAASPDVMAVFCGRFSPVALELAPIAQELGVPLLDPWAAADEIVRQPAPNYVFRLSLTDTWAMQALLGHAQKRGYSRLAVLVPNTAWGRSSEAAALAHAKKIRTINLSVHWYNWGDTDFASHLARVRAEGAQALIMVANDFEGSRIVMEMATLAPAQRLPIISHWGIVGGDFAAATGDALREVDLVVVQTFSFSGARSRRAQTVAAGVKRLFGHDVDSLRSQVGFAHAYDLTYLLAAALRKAGRPDRAVIRDALEGIVRHEGLVGDYLRPFSASDHEALDRRHVFIARFDARGNLRALGSN